MNFPVREGVDDRHHFNEILEKAEGLKNLVGPVFDLEQRQHVFKVSFIYIQREILTLYTLSLPPLYCYYLIFIHFRTSSEI